LSFPAGTFRGENSVSPANCWLGLAELLRRHEDDIAVIRLFGGTHERISNAGAQSVSLGFAYEEINCRSMPLRNRGGGPPDSGLPQLFRQLLHVRLQ
jgi:hypothetical protein